MKRPLGCLSIYGWIASLALVSVVTIVTLLNGPKLFSPGPLTAVRRQDAAALRGTLRHADFESQCTLCHRPWKTVDPARCLACHTSVENQIAAHSGIHGRWEDPESCVQCHPDHQGREVDIAQTARDSFLHDEVGFSLVRHRQGTGGTDIRCADCHTAMDEPFDPLSCAACHQQMAPAFMAQHVDRNGIECLSCHDGTAWADGFDHDFFFPLDGAHAGLGCETCHSQDARQDLTAACATCHEEPDIHRGQFGTDCAACHGTNGWRPAQLRYHTFSLTHGEPADVDCLTCHPAGYTAYDCTGCHEHSPAETERQHRGKRAAELAACVSCHPTGHKDEE
jgi:hypothetical protein